MGNWPARLVEIDEDPPGSLGVWLFWSGASLEAEVRTIVSSTGTGRL